MLLVATIVKLDTHKSSKQISHELKTEMSNIKNGVKHLEQSAVFGKGRELRKTTLCDSTGTLWVVF